MRVVVAIEPLKEEKRRYKAYRVRIRSFVCSFLSLLLRTQIIISPYEYHITHESTPFILFELRPVMCGCSLCRVCVSMLYVYMRSNHEISNAKICIFLFGSIELKVISIYVWFSMCCSNRPWTLKLHKNGNMHVLYVCFPVDNRYQ